MDMCGEHTQNTCFSCQLKREEERRRECGVKIREEKIDCLSSTKCTTPTYSPVQCEWMNVAVHEKTWPELGIFHIDLCVWSSVVATVSRTMHVNTCLLCEKRTILTYYHNYARKSNEILYFSILIGLTNIPCILVISPEKNMCAVFL